MKTPDIDLSQAFTDDWMVEFEPIVSCYHPREERHLMHAWVERCSYCGETRATEELNKQSSTFWPPTTKPWSETPRA